MQQFSFLLHYAIIRENPRDEIPCRSKFRQYEQRDAAQAAEIWNEVVEDGKAFPQMEKLDEVTGHAFFTEQTYTGVAYDAATG